VPEPTDTRSSSAASATSPRVRSRRQVARLGAAVGRSERDQLAFEGLQQVLDADPRDVDIDGACLPLVDLGHSSCTPS